ncbi:MAG: ABC transporter permease, partial [Desulfobacterota bacterium]|nr:ABC transporter permease [Thermodesulfobacteriota bacterium]
MARRIKALLYKEFIQMLRDPLALILLIVLPVFLLFIFGYAINLDVRNIPLAVYNLDRTEYSRSLIDRFVTSGYFVLKRHVTNYQQATHVLDAGEVRVVLCIPRNFQKDVQNGKCTPVQVLIDGTDSNTANIAMSYVKSILQTESLRVVFSLLNSNGQMTGSAIAGLDIRPNIWYNPELSSINFLVPGIIGIIIMVIGAIRMSVSLVKEREKGTIESLMVSPLRPIELMIGKITPYICVVFVDLILIVLAGRCIFNVPFRGSVTLFLVLSFIFLGSALGSGLYISSIAKTSQVAWLIGFLATILPAIILSGFVFPI